MRRKGGEGRKGDVRNGNNGREQDQEPEDVDPPVAAETVQGDEDHGEGEGAGAEDLQRRGESAVQNWSVSVPDGVDLARSEQETPF